MYLGLILILLFGVLPKQFLCDGETRPIRDIIKINLGCNIDHEDEHPEESRKKAVTVDRSHPLGEIYRSEHLENVEDRCNLCECLDRSFPIGIRNRQIIMPNREESGASDPYMSSAADNPLPAFAPPPNRFQLHGKSPTTDDAAIYEHVQSMRKLQKVIILANMVERFDKYLYERAKRILSRLAFLAKDYIE